MLRDFQISELRSMLNSVTPLILRKNLFRTLALVIALFWSLALIRTLFLSDLIGTYVNNCHHVVFMCFSMLMRCVFKYIFRSFVMDIRD